jgi:thiamine biosynthesis lipoprotein
VTSDPTTPPDDGPGTPPGGETAVTSGGTTVRHDEEVMGTVVSFEVHPGNRSGRRVRAAVRQACRVLHEADRVFSTWVDTSPVNRFRRGELALEAAPGELGEVIDLCEAARDLSGGWFDPWAMPGGFDPTGLVKGWAVQRACDVLAGSGVAGALVNGGGDIATWGHPEPGGPWRVGIRHPWHPDGLACIIAVDGAVATSGTYERGRHLIDPTTGRAGCRAASATVTGPSLAVADALATALAVGGDAAFDLIEDVEGYDAYLIGTGGRERMSPAITVLS